MMDSLAREAEKCRSEARRFAGKPEGPFLLRLSEAFDELAHRGSTADSGSIKANTRTFA